MHVHRKARFGFLILREDVFQKTSPDQVCTHYFVSMEPLLRAQSMVLVQAVSCGNAAWPCSGSC